MMKLFAQIIAERRYLKSPNRERERVTATALFRSALKNSGQTGETVSNELRGMWV